MTSPVLSVCDLAVSFRLDRTWQSVVSDLSFDIGAGETVAIVGESGSGKSVTALAVMRLLPVNARIEGNIALADRQLLTLREEDMRRVRGNEISMIFQEPMTSLNPVLTIGFQIAEALIYHRGLSRHQAEAEALRILDRVRIPAARQRLHDYPHRFSGGMRQRVMIAMALACRPKLLIADEPTTSLDVTTQAQILTLIKALQDEDGMSVLFITHDMGVVAEIADRVLVLRNGRKIELDTAPSVFALPKHPYTRSLLSAVPKLGDTRGHATPVHFPVNGTTGVSAPTVPVTSTVDETSRPVLEVSGLTARFDIRSGLVRRVTGRVHAIENVSFSIRAGETLALVGESGCGKSTTGRSVLRLVQPTAGTIIFDGTDLSKLTRAELRTVRRRMQMVFQDPFASLNPKMTVGAAIAEPMVVHGLADPATALDRVTALLFKVGLTPDMASRFPHEFSGGQRQRLCIARALGLSPLLIVADEAVSALDVSIKAQVINLLMSLQAELGLAYLFISHDIAVVERVSHRIAVMYLGEIVEIGPRAAVIENAQHPYTRKLIQAVPIPDPRRRSERRGLANEEIPSSVRRADYVSPPRTYREVSPGHVVQEWH